MRIYIQIDPKIQKARVWIELIWITTRFSEVLLRTH